jgi:CubicO group peptidase (beta-lactamase class C family)
MPTTRQGQPSGVGSRRLFAIRVLVTLAGLAAGACGENPTGTSFSETQGIPPAVLDSVASEAAGIPGMFSLLVQRNGVLVQEQYFHGFTPDSLHDVRSVTKSVMAILTGIAIEEGYLPSVDSPVGPYLLPVVDSLRPEVADVSIRHFLMMSSGLDWHELDMGTSYSDWWLSSDMVQFVVDLPIVHEPGQQFIYNTGASHLLSVILTEATGMPTLDFARQHLFDPLGFSDSSWLQENRGYYTGGMGLRITARDMVKIGQMVLDRGVWGGARMVPEAWIADATSPLLPTQNLVPFTSHYGYLWWLRSGGGRDFVLANGYGGQFILVDPDLDLVIVSQANWRGLGWELAGEQWYRILQLIVEGLLPAVE